jgi:hypothetical protein
VPSGGAALTPEPWHDEQVWGSLSTMSFRWSSAFTVVAV